MSQKSTFTDETKLSIIQAQHGYCKICEKHIHSIHHKLENTKPNSKNYPLFMHSPLNGVGLCMDCHTNLRHLQKITIQEAGLYEDYLRELKGVL